MKRFIARVWEPVAFTAIVALLCGVMTWTVEAVLGVAVGVALAVACGEWARALR